MKPSDVSDLLAILRRYGVSHYQTKEVTVDLQPSSGSIEMSVVPAGGDKPDENLPFDQAEARRQREQVAYHSSE